MSVNNKILSYNGTQFLAKQFKEFLVWEGVNHILISKFHPQSNPAECVMCELRRLCWTYCASRHSKLIDMVTEFEKVLNEL